MGVAWGRGRDLVEEVGEPEKVVSVADGPVKVDAAVCIGSAIKCRGLLRGGVYAASFALHGVVMGDWL